MPVWVPWVLMPFLGGIIGFATNWLAIKMLFHPRKKILGFQGLLPRRQEDLATRVGKVVAEELLDTSSLMAPLAKADLTPHIEKMVDIAIEKKAKDLQSIPLIGSFITPDRLSGIKKVVVSEFADNQGKIVEALEDVAKRELNIAEITRAKLAALDLDNLERVVADVAKREFRAIEWWGAILGAMIGLMQAALVSLWGVG